ncbi:DUF2087 domain-containing protein [Halalkalibacillus halophilus]|uniref:DUF2087 domain-containing protein n=1 Tax=Halalkalibacillus halophilus TaxID=392827 RepID=UPI0004222CCC|nr:DUF2087 domain-containing protein [Halalkalibacillus halophilus]
MEKSEEFWTASVEEMQSGYIFDEVTEIFSCLICGQTYEQGVIYPFGELWCEAKKAMKAHIHEQHGSMFDYLISLDKKWNGLSDHQKELLHYFKQGKSDKEIVNSLEGGSASTIRNHRFKLREKEKQAKAFLSIMNLLEKKEEEFIPYHKGATMVDDRYATTEQEREKILSTYFKDGLDGKLSNFPSKEKRKLVVLREIMNRFDQGKTYTEKEVNEQLKQAHDDFATIRRYLIEYGFMDRSKDCTEYWVNN